MTIFNCQMERKKGMFKSVFFFLFLLSAFFLPFMPLFFMHILVYMWHQYFTTVAASVLSQQRSSAVATVLYLRII
jgi:hypothetical protein